MQRWFFLFTQIGVKPFRSRDWTISQQSLTDAPTIFGTMENHPSRNAKVVFFIRSNRDQTISVTQVLTIFAHRKIYFAL